MFFGNKKSSVGRMTENDADIIAKNVILISCLTAGTDKGCFKDPSVLIRRQLALEIACYLPTKYIFNITANHFFETVQSDEIEKAAKLIGDKIAQKSTQYLNEVRTESQFLIREDINHDIKICVSNTFRDSTLCYINQRLDLMQINEINFLKFLRSTGTKAPKSSMQIYAFAIFKYRILNLFNLREFSHEWMDLCEWLNMIDIEFSNQFKAINKILSCK